MTFPAPSSAPPDPPTADREWFGGRRWTGIFAVAMVLVVVLAVALFIALRHGDKSGSVASTAPPMVVGTATGSAPSTGASPASTQVPTSAPSGVTWNLYNTVALPTSNAGPRNVDGAVATGYSRTPAGALMAAANAGYRILLANSAEWQTVADRMLAPGGGRDAYVRIEASAAPAPGTVSTGNYTQIAGFQFVSYTPDAAAIQLVGRTPQGTLQVGIERVVWLDGDWKLLLPESGTGSAQVANSLNGFVPWSGV